MHSTRWCNNSPVWAVLIRSHTHTTHELPIEGSTHESFRVWDVECYRTSGAARIILKKRHRKLLRPQDITMTHNNGLSLFAGVCVCVYLCLCLYLVYICVCASRNSFIPFEETVGRLPQFYHIPSCLAIRVRVH